MLKSVFVEKKPNFRTAEKRLAAELCEELEIPSLKNVRILNRYFVQGITEEVFQQCEHGVFAEAPNDVISHEMPSLQDNEIAFGVEVCAGQFDQRAASCAECIQLISPETTPTVTSAKIYILQGDIDEHDLKRIKDYLINPVEMREASLEVPETLETQKQAVSDVEVLDGFTQLSNEQLKNFIQERGLAMSVPDLICVRDYFSSIGRQPTITEIKVIDTYWSDHCRHTTFNTELENIQIEDERVEKAFERYEGVRQELGREDKPITLMDMGTIAARYLKAKGKLDNLDESEEVNACTVKVQIDVDTQGQEQGQVQSLGHALDQGYGEHHTHQQKEDKEQPQGQMQCQGEERQDWLFFFKNETHNHPTEIEPFGGAATCIGGCIRDPLSGRAWVYQAMRVSGAADPRTPIKKTIYGKLPQRKICIDAAQGYSSYGNQIGLATGCVHEIYHPSYAAKRMEVGAVLGAAPASNVKRLTPQAGDKIILLGGRTGRDGIGGATGSSKAHTSQSVENLGAEVQKGNAVTERKICRLFRRPEAASLIKRCNDFGAGGVSVAIGELCDGVTINLDSILCKYDGLDGTELAISESQERMAVVLADSDVEKFISYAHEENLEATLVAEVSKEPHLKMLWRNKEIVDIKREFLDTNGAKRYQNVAIPEQDFSQKDVQKDMDSKTIKERFKALLANINIASNKGLAERFDSTIGSGSVLMPFGGKTQLTQPQAMVSKFPSFGKTNAVSGMSWGFNPYIMEADQFGGAYLSVLESVCKLIATGFKRKDIYLTLQEYFEKLVEDKFRWGKPTAALLGALSAQLDLEVAAIGGKDSMSGSFEDMDVCPTLLSFAVSHAKLENIISPEIKGADHELALISPQTKSILTCLDIVEALIEKGSVLSAYAIGLGGAAEAIFKMLIGNKLGAKIDMDALERLLGKNGLFAYNYGSFILELAPNADIKSQIDSIIENLDNAAAPESADVAAAADDAVSADDNTKIDTATDTSKNIDERTQSIKADDVFAIIGKTQNEYSLHFYGEHPSGVDVPSNAIDEHLDLAELQQIYENALQSVYPYKDEFLKNDSDDGASKAQTSDETQTGSEAHANDNEQTQSTQELQKISFAQKSPLTCPSSFAHPKVIIPVFPGTNCEYDSAAAFEAAGGNPETFIINNLSANSIKQSAKTLAQKIKSSQILMIPGGFSGADEPDGAAKLIASFFRNAEVTEAVRDLLFNRDGLILGICNGFQALIKLGLVPFGDIVAQTDASPTLSFNTLGRHISRMVNTRVCSTLSPWLSHCKLDEVHNMPISHGEGRFIADNKTLETLIEKGQIATQYCNRTGTPSMSLDVNPNGSALAIEGITSADGRILGKMGHTERSADTLYKNIPGINIQPLFKGGIDYFA